MTVLFCLLANENRVVLESEDDQSDYICASFIDVSVCVCVCVWGGGGGNIGGIFLYRILVLGGACVVFRWRGGVKQTIII